MWAAPGAAQTLPDIMVDQVVRGAPGSVHLVATEAVDPDEVGSACDVVVTGGNNQSVHPDTDLLINSGTDQVIAPNVEADADGVIDTEGTLVLGDTIEVFVRLGADGVFSGGFTISISCQAPPVTTTTAAPPTTASQVTTTTTDSSTSVAVAGISEEPGASGGTTSGTLPRTGSSVPGAPLAIAIGAVVAGVALLVGPGARRARR